MEPTENSNAHPFNTFEEYKLLVEDTARMTDRRQSTSMLYLTINTTLLAGLLLILENNERIPGNVQSMPQAPVLMIIILLALFLTAIFLNITWKRMIEKYKKLIRIRFDVLFEIEDLPGMQGSVKVYHREAVDLYPRDENGQVKPSKQFFSSLELLLPKVFIGLYIGLIIITIILTLI